MFSPQFSFRRSRFALLALVLSTFVPVAAFAAAEDVPGVGNFHRVNEQVYRGAQPTPAGFANLAKLGVATVIDLREAGERARTEEKVVKAAGMRYVNIPMR